MSAMEARVSRYQKEQRKAVSVVRVHFTDTARDFHQHVAKATGTLCVHHGDLSSRDTGGWGYSVKVPAAKEEVYDPNSKNSGGKVPFAVAERECMQFLRDEARKREHQQTARN